MSDQTLDLDALAPKSKTVTLDGKKIVVQPPKTGQIIRVSALGQRLKDFSKTSPEEIEVLEADVTKLMLELAPELPADLAFVQKVAVLNMVAEMSMPPEAKALQERGVTADTSKATPSGSSAK